MSPGARPDHDNGGEMSVPSQVYCAGISPPGEIAGLASIMSEKRLRSGLLVHPDLTPA